MSVFLRGIITPDYLPLVDKFFLVGPKEDIPVTAILDTGFSGTIVLPHALRSAGQFEFSGLARYELANGHIILVELYKTTIRIGKRTLAADISFTDSTLGMIGMAFIDGKRAIFDLQRHIFKVLE